MAQAQEIQNQWYPPDLAMAFLDGLESPKQKAQDYPMMETVRICPIVVHIGDLHGPRLGPSHFVGLSCREMPVQG